VTEIDNITLLLKESHDGRAGALDDLMRIVYDDLERMAAAYIRRKFGDRAKQITLEPAALVNESFLRLIKQRSQFDNRGHFFAIATKMMMRILIDYQRQRSAQKRGGDQAEVTLMLDADAPVESGSATRMIEVERLAEALGKLEQSDHRMADVVKMRVVWGLSVEEVAASLGVSTPTVKRDWRFAKAWLAEEMGV